MFAPMVLLCLLYCPLAFSKPSSDKPANLISADALFIAAKDAARSGDIGTLANIRNKLDHYPLADYVQYWHWRQTLDAPRQTLDADALRAWLAQRSGSLVADLLRRDWLLRLGRQQDWLNFRQEYPQWILRDDREALCYGALSQMVAGVSNAAAEARRELAQAREMPAGCQALLAYGLRTGQLNSADALDNVRLMFNNNRRSAALSSAELLQSPLLSGSDIQFAYDRPLQAVRQWRSRLPEPVVRELIVLALVRYARESPDVAADMLRSMQNQFSKEQSNFLWGQIGMAGTKRLLDDALGWYQQVSATDLTGEALEWRVRAALRAQDWEMVRASIEAMNEVQRSDATWVYWLGRAYAAQGKAQQAAEHYRKIAQQFNFYGKLALEELGGKILLPVHSAALSAHEIAMAQQNPGLLRALKFYELDMRFEGNREWNFALRGMTDRQLLAAAEFAHQQKIYDRAINTADRTQTEHDFRLRFLMPFRADLGDAVQRAGLDEPYVYGLIRQESRFITSARSGVGASGLMQLMPATARLVAKKLGWNDFQPQQVNEINKNLILGTTYLRMVLDGADQSPVLAAAGYNAGPNRPRTWRSRFHFGKPIEGAIFAETIPFNETRDYVKKVMSNAVYYAALIEGRNQSLKSRLGIIQPINNNKLPDNGEP